MHGTSCTRGDEIDANACLDSDSEAGRGTTRRLWNLMCSLMGPLWKKPQAARSLARLGGRERKSTLLTKFDNTKHCNRTRMNQSTNEFGAPAELDKGSPRCSCSANAGRAQLRSLLPDPYPKIRGLPKGAEMSAVCVCV